MKPLNIPVGISDFSEIRKNGYYYVDKSFLIRELLKIPGTQGYSDHKTPAFQKNPWNEYAGKLFRYPQRQ